jgi:hypothetical protein
VRSRIRTVKPEILTDEVLWDLGTETGYPILQAFQGLWMYADREGRFEWRPRSLKTLILPFWSGDFDQLMAALEKARFIIRYEVDGKAYGVVRSFKKHQVINQREARSELPEPPSECMHVHARVSANIASDVRDTVLARDKHACRRCGDASDLTIDHIFPRSLGGTHALSNLRTLCRSCNSARPVSGQALIDDLAKDGLSLEDMQRMCMHVHAPGEGNGKGTEGNGKGNGTPSRARGREGGGDPDFEDDPDGLDPRGMREPPELERPTVELLREAYETAFRAANQDHEPTWSKPNVRALGVLASWVDGELKGANAFAFVDRLIRAFFAHEDAKEAMVPIALLATNPAKYLAPRTKRGNGKTRSRDGFRSPEANGAYAPTDLDGVFGKASRVAEGP